MRKNCKMIGLLTPSQADVLKTLFELEEQTASQRFWRPKELGAYRSSHHAMTLRKLVELGLVEREAMGAGERATQAAASRQFGYRISADGRETWELMRELSTLPAHAVLGGARASVRPADLARAVTPRRPALRNLPDLSAFFRGLAKA